MRTKLSLFLAAVLGLLSEKMSASAGQVPENMVWIPPGTFMMGSPETEILRSLDETQHQVTIGHGFYMSKYETTQREYKTLTGREPFGRDLDSPVIYVSWLEATSYCEKLTQQERVAGRVPNGYAYRLPTEAEWEYACRAGTTTPFHYGNDLRHSMANFSGIYEYVGGVNLMPNRNATMIGYTTTVGSYQPNAFGLYDMHGNVWEWCLDWYGSYPNANVRDPAGPTSGSERVLRGGAWSFGVEKCRSSYRYHATPNYTYEAYGFRPVLALDFPSWATDVFAKLPEPVQPTYSEPPKKEAGKDSLVVVTHGWIRKEDGQTKPPNPDWVDDMMKAVRKNLENRGLKNWQVEGYKWMEKAWMKLPDVLLGTLLDNADKEGVNLGEYLKKQGWKHVHFIGHSAGAAVIQTASILVKENDLTTTIHTTFLDAYVGIKYGGRSKYGLASDWSDSYFARDPETFDSLFSRTAGYLDYAYGVDITWLEPNKRTITVYRSGNGITGMVPCNYTVTSHDWPHEFYLKTIPPETTTGAELFGFPLSKEGGNWDFATKIYPVEVKSAYIKVLGRPDSDCPALGESRVPTYLGPRVDLDKVQTVTSTTGIIKNNGSGLIITSGGKLQQQSLQGIRKNAPTTPESAWFAASIIVTNTVNFVSFDAQFLGTKAEGLLTTYWQTNTIGTIDERVILPGLQHYTYALPPTATNSSYTLGFRLDSFSNTVSSIAITNVAFGFIGIREPFELAVIGTNANGTHIFSLTGPSGYDYRVDYSTNLVDWKTTAILVNTNGVVHFTDPGSTNTPTRFYRAATP